LPYLASLKAAKTLKEFAPLIGLMPSQLSYALFISSEPKYSIFEIPKKGGGVRTIEAPNDRLKAIQANFADLLYNCREEIEAANPDVKSPSHGFRRNHSIITNARKHRKQRFVLNLDIENFFPSINFGRVRGFFMKDDKFTLNERVATVIAQIACRTYEAPDGSKRSTLPQGSPCSPVIADLIGHLLDVRLVQLAKLHKCTYSRYADDLTISTNTKNFPEEIAYQQDAQNHLWVLGDAVLERISSAGFSVNHKKTRMQYRTARQTVTGLTVNEKVNVPLDYYRSTRLMCAGLFATGGFHKHGAGPGAGGEPEKGTLPQLEGMVNHVFFVKQEETRRKDKNRKQQTKGKKSGNENANKDKSGINKLYARLLFYKHFVALDMPLILCEGKTDSIYLRAALKTLPVFSGKLYFEEGGKKKNKIRFFKYSDLARELLNLGGGTGDFIAFINRYKDAVQKNKSRPLSHPVVLLIDNDAGAKPIFEQFKHLNMSLVSTEPFYHITQNLYLVKTPEAPGDGKSMIEDLFDPELLTTELDGKKFNPDKQHEAPGEYGKIAFAEKVVVPKVKVIDFAKFSAIFERVSAVMDHYATMKGEIAS
jgi:RNA-directed DNA polymerase